MEAMLTTFLAPLLPFLLRKGEQVAGEAVDKVGAAVWERAQAVWGRLAPRLAGDAGAERALEAVAHDPGDDTAKAALQFQLRELLDSDQVLAQELKQLLREAEEQGEIAANGAITIGGDVSADRGGVVSIGNLFGGIHTCLERL